MTADSKSELALLEQLLAEVELQHFTTQIIERLQVSCASYY